MCPGDGFISLSSRHIGYPVDLLQSTCENGFELALNQLFQHKLHRKEFSVADVIVAFSRAQFLGKECYRVEFRLDTKMPR